MLFEVIECEWLNLVAAIEQAESIDDILDSHHKFLDTIRTKIFLDETGRGVSGTLETIYRHILALDAWQDKLGILCGRELQQRVALDEEVALSERMGKYGITKEQQFDRDQALKVFQHRLQAHHVELKKIAMTYEQAVKQFLLLLAESKDLEVQGFGNRIDFNDFFKKNDSRLQEQGTFARQSSIYLAKKAAAAQGDSSSPRAGLQGRYTMSSKMHMARY